MNKANIYLLAGANKLQFHSYIFIIQPKMSYAYLHTSLCLAADGQKMISKLD